MLSSCHFMGGSYGLRCHLSFPMLKGLAEMPVNYLCDSKQAEMEAADVEH